MRYVEIEIKNYIPLLHCGTKSVKINITSNTLIVIGTNGCGKSSLFREITPYPANRPDYEKNGLKRIVVTHGNSTYELTSDFSKPSKAHSFIKDGEELNESGTNATQIDLCNTHFGITEVISSLINLDYHICDMGRADRKNLFMVTYPHSMGFILDYHKKVCYQLRDFSANIKVFNERRISLEEQILNPTELERINTLHKKYQSLNNDIDQQIYAIKQKMELMSGLDAYSSFNTEEVFIDNSGQRSMQGWLDHVDSVVTHCLHVLAKVHKSRKEKTIWAGDKTGRVALLNSLIGYKSNSRNSILEMEEETIKLKEDLDQYEQTKGIDLEKEIELLEIKIKNLTEMIEVQKKIYEGKEFPKASSLEDLYKFNQGLMARIRYLLSEVFQSNVIWSPTKIMQTRNDIEAYSLIISNDKRELENLIARHAELKQQSTVIENIDPNCKSTICKLKEKVEQKLNETNKLIDSIVEIGKAKRKELEEREKRLDEMRKEISAPNDVHNYVVELIDSLKMARLCNYICDNAWDEDEFIDMLNNNPSKVWDKLNAYTELNEAYLRVREYERDIQLAKQELDTLKKVHLPAKDLIIKTISEKQLRHKILIEKISELKDKLKASSEVESDIREILDQEMELDYVLEELKKFHGWYSIKIQLDAMDETIKFLQSGKNKVTSSLLELETIIKEQNGLLTRLNQEVLPNLKHYESEYDKWSMIEKGLSPNSGIPHKYMVVYLNALIGIVNKIIKSVWVYDMEILPICEENDLNYGFQFTVNNGEPIKDINLASKGQKEIMDLAWVLAIFHQMKLGKQYPLKLDEPDGGLNNEHRIRLLNFLTQMMQNEDLGQLFMINQFPSVYDSFGDSQTLCIKEEGILLPAEYNQDIEIVHT